MTTKREAVFQPRRPTIWRGRYRRIPGDSTAFHIWFADGFWWPFILWRNEGYNVECFMEETGAAKVLAESVSAVKREQQGSGGGSFLINEFGQVIVPPWDGGLIRKYVGDWTGPLRFKYPLRKGVSFDLCSDDGLSPGDPWVKPYLGVAYNLSVNDRIYFKEQTAGQEVARYPPKDNDYLVRMLRRIRRRDAVRFLVLPRGIVLTKVPQGSGNEEDWVPHYVGRIDFEEWFEKEG